MHSVVMGSVFSNQDFSAKGVVSGPGGLESETTPEATKLRFKKNTSPRLWFKHRNKIPDKIPVVAKYRGEGNKKHPLEIWGGKCRP